MTYTTLHIDVENDKSEIREMTADEIKDIETSKKEREARIAQQSKDAEAKQAILDRLGLTAEEAALLLK